MTSFGFDIPLTLKPAIETAALASGRTAPGFALVPAEEVAALVPAWRELCRRGLDGNPFFHSDFLLPAMEAFGRGRVKLATVGGIDGRLLALAPVIETRFGRLAAAVSVWTHPYAPLGTPLLDAAVAENALSSLIMGMARHFGRTRAVVFPFVEPDGRFGQLLQRGATAMARRIDVFGSHERARFVRAGGPDLRNMLDTKRRKEFARQMRRLAESGTLTIETMHAADAVTEAFEEFLALEAEGWKGRRRTAMLQDDAVATFARRAVAGLARNGLCEIDAIRLDGKPVAMLVSLMGGDGAATWKITYDEAFARFSPGVQLMLEATRSLTDNPMVRQIDSLATADHPMIDHLWRDRQSVATMVLAPAEGTLAYQAGLAAARAERVAKRRLRQWLKR